MEYTNFTLIIGVFHNANNRTKNKKNKLKTIADFYHLSLDELVGRDFSENYSDEFERRIMSYIKQMDDEGKKLSLGLLSQVVNHRGNNENI